MADDPISRSIMLRDHADRLWRLSLDQSKRIPPDIRRELGRLADEFEEMAERVRKELVENR